MESIETLRTFLGWALLVNLGFYLLTALCLLLCRGLVTNMSSRLFGIEPDVAMRESYAFLGRFKLAIIVFFLAPYLALRLMG